MWHRAADSLPRSNKRRSRKVSAAWALLLAGAVVGVGALARPAHLSVRPARRIAVALHAAAELGEGAEDVWRPVRSLLDRLASQDRVQLILPAVFQASDKWLSPEQAKRELRFVRPVGARADELTLPPGSRGAQRVYHFVPAGRTEAIARGPAITVIELPTRLPAVTLDAVGAESAAGETTQVFLAVRNHGRAPWRGQVRVSSGLSAIVVGPGQRAGFVRRVPAAGTVSVELFDEGGEALGGFASSAALVSRTGRVRSVAMIGPDERLIRRFVEADPLLRLVGEPGEADLVIANGIGPPSGKPAIVINAPRAPAGWRRGEARESVMLESATIDADDPVMRDVSLDGVAVRTVEPFVPTAEGASHKQLCRIEGGALILRSTTGRTRRIHVAFGLNEQNTNFAMYDAFVVLLANSARWLSPGGDTGPPRFEFRSPLASQGIGWLTTGGAAAGSVLAVSSDPLPRAGIHRGPAGEVLAVSLVGLRGGQPNTSPDVAVAAAPLPEPAGPAEAAELWWILALAAMTLWLVAWAIRTR